MWRFCLHFYRSLNRHRRFLGGWDKQICSFSRRRHSCCCCCYAHTHTRAHAGAHTHTELSCSIQPSELFALKSTIFDKHPLKVNVYFVFSCIWLYTYTYKYIFHLPIIHHQWEYPTRLCFCCLQTSQWQTEQCSDSYQVIVLLFANEKFLVLMLGVWKQHYFFADINTTYICYINSQFDLPGLTLRCLYSTCPQSTAGSMCWVHIQPSPTSTLLL